MRAVRIAQFGGSENLKFQTDVPIPEPLADEVLINVKAAGINPVDTYIRTGTYHPIQLPYTPGRDAAGIVERVGESVKGYKKGDRVLAAIVQSGSYAEYCTVKSKYLCPLHESLSFTQGASIGIPYYTAYAAIHKFAYTKPGEIVLVHGASGAVGIAAVQMLKAHGCTVIGTAGTPEGIKLVRQHGADEAYNHREKDYMQQILNDATGGQGVDVIIEMLANVNLEADMQIVAKRGRIVVVGCRGSIEINPRWLMKSQASIIGTSLLTIEEESEWQEMHAAVSAGQRVGWLKPEVAKVYKMEEAAQGQHDVIHNSGTVGKLVIDTTL